MSDTAYKIKVMQAFLDGKEVQVRPRSISICPWSRKLPPDMDPEWDWVHFEYRIKPEPIVLWLNVYDGGDSVYVHRSEAQAVSAADHDENAIAVAIRIEIQPKE